MADQTARWLEGVDAPRAVPPAIQTRLAAAIEANMLAPVPENFPYILDRPKRLPGEMRERLAARLVVEDTDIVHAMGGVDEWRPIPTGARARMEAWAHRRSRWSPTRVYQAAGVAACLVLVMVGVLVISRDDPRVRPNAGSIPSVVAPPASVPGVTAPKPTPTTKVLGTKETNPPKASTPGTPKSPRRGLTVSPIDSGSDAGEELVPPPVERRTAASSAGTPSPSARLDLLGAVGSVLDEVLRALSLSPGRTGSIRGLPADDASMTAPNLSPSPQAKTTPSKSTPAKRKRTKPARTNTTTTRTANPAATPATEKAAPPVSLLSLPPLTTIIGDATEPLLQIGEPGSALSISL